MVVMGYWLCDVILSSYLNGSRYDLGFYAGRIYGALATSFVLAVLVLENSRLYRRLAIAARRLKERATELLRANEALQSEMACRKQAEEGLRQAQAELARVSQISAMGELTSSLAHEVNHPIGAIMINAETCVRWLSHEVPNVEKARTIAGMIVRDGTRASETVARMQHRFDNGAPLREPVEINDVIREMIVLLRGEAARHDVSIRTELAENLPEVAGDRVQLKQVLMNLMINGIEAMNDGHGAQELTITSATGGKWRGRGFRQRYRHRAAAVAGEPDLQRVRHHKAPQHRHRSVDQPLHRRGAWRPSVGDQQFVARREFSSHPACDGGPRLRRRSMNVTAGGPSYVDMTGFFPRSNGNVRRAPVIP